MTTSSTSTPDADRLLAEALHRVWGFSEFRPLQREAMHAILDARDSIVVLPTGGGKSLCFQAPAIVAGPTKVGRHVRNGPTEVGRHAQNGPTEVGRHAQNGPTEVGRHAQNGPIEVGRHAQNGPTDVGPHESQDGPQASQVAAPQYVASDFSRTGLALVVSPLISLMKDQVDGLRVDGVAASYLNSTLLPHERDEVLASVRDDRCRLLYVSPERLVGEGSQPLRRMLQQAGVRYVAIDEAHCISQWGHDFRPEYRQLGRLREDFPGVSFHAFTATATERVRRDIVTELRLQEPLVLVGSFDRPNLTYRVLRRGHLHSQLLEILARHDGEAGIVYCLSRRDVESLAEWLKAQGLRALPYHAGLPDEARSRHQEAFLDERA